MKATKTGDLGPYLTEMEEEIRDLSGNAEILDYFIYLRDMLKVIHNDGLPVEVFSDVANVDTDNPTFERLREVRHYIATPRETLQAIETLQLFIDLLSKEN